jgi:crossover junction endodeoxyribonuclease RusA
MTEGNLKPIRPKAKPRQKIHLDLPIPPSANKLWRRAGDRVHRSAEYMGWTKTAGWELLAQRPVSLPGSVKLVVRAGLPPRPRDLDNLLKALCDLLEEHGIVENDASVTDIDARWDRTVATGRVRVTAWATSHPSRRATAEQRKNVVRGTKAAFDAAFSTRRVAAL